MFKFNLKNINVKIFLTDNLNFTSIICVLRDVSLAADSDSRVSSCSIPAHRSYQHLLHPHPDLFERRLVDWTEIWPEPPGSLAARALSSQSEPQAPAHTHS